MFQFLIALILGTAAALVIYELYVGYLNYSIARSLSSEKVKEESLPWDKIIVEEIARGNVSYVKVGIFNRGDKQAEIKINSDNISDDLTTGSVLLT